MSRVLEISLFLPRNPNVVNLFTFIAFIFSIVLESSEWPRVGLFSGVTYHLGDWAACLRSSGPNIKGQYCLVEATYNFKYGKFELPAPDWVDWPPENASVWEVLTLVNFLYSARRLLFSK